VSGGGYQHVERGVLRAARRRLLQIVEEHQTPEEQMANISCTQLLAVMQFLGIEVPNRALHANLGSQITASNSANPSSNLTAASADTGKRFVEIVETMRRVCTLQTQLTTQFEFV